MSRLTQFLRPARLLALAALSVASALPALAGSYTYSNSQRTVNAGVLINGTAAATDVAVPDPAPYLFYLLNQRADIKPFGWTILNPNAPPAVTQNIETRWANAYPQVGQTVYPYMAAYWEVPLSDVSSDQLKQYDVLYLPYTGGNLAAADNEKLRRFVDGGGTLLVDYASSAQIPPFGLFTDVQFASGSTALGLPSAGTGLTLRHPLITRPFFLGADDILTLGLPAFSGKLSGAGSGDFGNLFVSVITQPSSTSAVCAAALGAGQVVVSGLDIGGAINNSAGPNGNAGPFFGNPGTAFDPSPNYTYAPAQDLKFLANVISLVDMHPAESKSGHQNGAGNDLPSFAPTWAYMPSPAGSSTPPGAAVWGGFVFVTDAGGTLRAFDAFPQEDLTGTGGPDDGVQDYGIGLPYDQIWSVALASGTTYSAPTVGVYGGKPTVFVEKSDGSVAGYDPVTGALTQTLAPKAPSTFSGTPPSPTVYGGRVYAGQSTGSLLVYDSNSGASAAGGVLIPTGLGSEPATASPTVGLVPDGTANDIVALVPTTQNIYSVLLGARGDTLAAYPPAGPATGYNLSNKFHLNPLVPDALSTPKSIAFSGIGFEFATSATQPYFVGPLGTGTVYGNWDVDFMASLPSNPGTANLNLNQFSGASYGAVINSIGFTAAFSPSAMDRAGDFYYTDNAGGFSYLVGVHDNAQFQNVQMKWRFRMPTTAENITDADGVNYQSLSGFHFVGAPVVDNQGYVYAAATSGSQAAVLCFVANGQVYADGLGGFDLTRAVVQQPDEFSATTPNQLLEGSVDSVAKYGEFTASGSQITFYNFGRGANGVRQLAGNLSEPQPVTVIPPLDPTTGATGTPADVPLHTNLAWFTTPFPVTGAVSGLSKVGNALFLSDGTNLYQLPANPVVGAAKTVTVTIPASGPLVGIAVTPLPSGGVGTMASAPSVGQGAMILNGSLGISALTQQVTLIADNNRILETDSQGNALWAVDSTNHAVPASGAQPATVTKVDFSHPTSLSAVSANDYLVADTGNNRCVRFDRAGSVLWELTRFNDPNSLLAAGSPLTLSQPASVQMRREEFFNTQTGAVDHYLEHYLIADSGNYRVIEVTDTYTLNTTGTSIGTPVLTAGPTLTFATHTYDKDGRRFRYGSATYFGAGSSLSIAALATNTRASISAAGTLGPASGDSPGGSILTFGVAANTGEPTSVYTSFQAAGTTFPMRNPRFLSLTTTLTAPFYSFLYADDNGAFDLSYTGGVFTTYPNGLDFRQANYQGMMTSTPPITLMPINNGIIPNRVGLPFVPTCIQRIGSTSVGGVPMTRYLITQSHSQGELGDPGSTSIGGEIFEVDGVNTAVGTYSNGTLSRPAGTGPLTQPSFAIRP